MVAGHRRHIGGPHQLVLGLDGRDRCGVLPQQVRHRQRPHRHPVDRHRRRIHRRRQRRLKRRHRGPRLPGHRHGLRRHRTQPPRIRGRRGRHRRRRRTLPHPRRQARRHLPKRHRRRPQLLSQPIPRRGRRQQRARPRTRIHQHGVDFRGHHAAAAASNGLDPAPEYISTELISGGNTGNSITHSPSQPDTNPHRHPPHDVSTPR